MRFGGRQLGAVMGVGELEDVGCEGVAAQFIAQEPVDLVGHRVLAQVENGRGGDALLAEEPPERDGVTA